MDKKTHKLPLIPSDHDAQVIEDWLARQDSAHTKEAYRRDGEAMLRSIGKSLQHITLSDLEAYGRSLQGKPATRARKINAVKSLLSYAANIQYTPFNVGAALKSPKVVSHLAERILTIEEIDALIDAATDTRDKAILMLLFESGLRVSELCALEWSQIIKRKDGAQLSIVGKGQKGRQVPISPQMYDCLLTLKTENDSVFGLTRQRIHQIIKAAAQKAGVNEHVSAHWLRHSNISIALENGAPLSLVRDSAGHGNIAITSRYIHARPDDGTCNYLRKR